METFLTIAAIVIVSLATFFSHRNKPENTKNQSPTPTATAAPSPKLTTIPKPSGTNTPSSTQEPKENQKNLDLYIYPKSEIISESLESIKLRSTEDTNEIIDWYKDKLKQNFSTKSEAISNANGNIQAKFEASNSTEILDVVINKDSAKLYTEILISTKS